MGNNCTSNSQCCSGCPALSSSLNALCYIGTYYNKCYLYSMSPAFPFTCPCTDNTKGICGGEGNPNINNCYCYQGFSGTNCQIGSYSKHI